MWALTYMNPHVIKDVYVVITGRAFWEVVDVNVDVNTKFEAVVPSVTVDVVDVVTTGRICWEVVDVNVDEIPIVGLLVTKNPKKRQFVSDRSRESRTERTGRGRIQNRSCLSITR